MSRPGKLALCLVGGMALSPFVHADDVAQSGNPYATVVERNIFGLNPPPPPNPNPPDLNPPPKITPNGIMTILGDLQVLFKVTPLPKPGSPPQPEESYILSEGQRQDDIEVVKIDEKNSIVTFINHGETQQLPLVVTMPSSTASTTPAAGQPAPGAGFRPGVVNPGGGPGARPRNFGQSYSGAGANFAGANTGGGSGYGSSGNVNNANNGNYLGNVPTHNSSTFNAASQIPEGMTPEVQTIAIEANRELTQQQVESGQLPPLPITELTPANAVGVGGAPLIAPPPSGP